MTERYFLVRISDGVRVQSHISADQIDQIGCVIIKTPCSMLHTLPGYTLAMREEDERQIAAYEALRQQEESAGE